MLMRTPELSRRGAAALVALLAALPAGSCGDNLAAPDGGPPDAPVSPVAPKPPRLGAQLDRMGRAAIGTALIGLRDATDPANMKQDAYNTADDPTMWASAPVAPGQSIVAEIAANLALFDVLDQGAAIPGSPGCHNQILYNGNVTGGGTPGPTSYSTLAGLLADDMLYVDTTKSSCGQYLALELEYASAGGTVHSQCGGRTPKHDVIDVSYSLLLAGLSGFTDPPALLPRFGDGVDAHTDVSDSSFPYFGSPH